MKITTTRTLAVSFLVLGASCAENIDPAPAPVVITEGACAIASGAAAPDALASLGCMNDFLSLSSEPLDASIPGARSVKVVVDQATGDTLYFQNSRKYKIHHEFAAANLSGNGKPVVPALSEFNQTEYFSPDRRFILGAVTYYEGPKVWALEVAPYDTASAEMIQRLHAKVAAAAWFGPALAFHPTSESVNVEAKKLPATIAIKTNDDLFAGIDYQPLNLATAIGKLRFVRSADLATSYVTFEDIVVLDLVPNDINVVRGIVTEEFQTPLSHVNVLSQNRKTPNMGLRGATTHPALKALEGQWVELRVGAFEWSIKAVSSSTAEAWWAAHRPAPIRLPDPDLGVRDLRDIEDVTVESATVSLRDALRTSVRAFGGKAAHYSILVKTPEVPIRRAFAIPAYYYVQFMEQNGLFAELDRDLADPQFASDPSVRDAKLKTLRDDIKAGAVDPAFQAALRAKLDAEYPGLSMRFRSSTNSEDLDGFPCAGCYESHTGDPNIGWDHVLLAIKKTWSSMFIFRTFEERRYAGIDHKSIVMPLLVHHNFPDEEANGVALTANPFDPTGNQPGFYVNVQLGGDAEVVHPPPGVTSDQFVYYFDQPGQPVTYLSHSSLVAAGTTVLTTAQIYELGKALSAIHRRFSPAYGPAAGNHGWYAMDIEFKFDGEPGEVAKLAVKQARPHPGRGQ